MDLLEAPDGLRTALVNFDEVVAGLLERIGEDLLLDPENPELEDLRRRLTGLLTDDIRAPSRASAVIPALYRIGDEVLETITTVARFSAANHVGLNELRVELVYPVNATAERWFQRLSHPSP